MVTVPMSADPDLAGTEKQATTLTIAAKQAAETVAGLVIDSDESCQWAVDYAAELRRKRTDLTGQRDAAIKPLNEVVKRVRSWFSPAIDTLEQAEKQVKSEVVAYKKRCEEEHTALLSNATTPQEVARAVEVLAAPTQGMHTRDAWSFEVVDPTLIPQEYWLLDEKRIAAEARALKGDLNIPGVRAVCNKTIVLK